ncbi:hypothetical protein [Streptomyces sp. NPDC002644]
MPSVPPGDFAPPSVPPDTADQGPHGDAASTPRTREHPRSTAPLGIGLILTGLAFALTCQALRLRRD